MNKFKIILILLIFNIRFFNAQTKDIKPIPTHCPEVTSNTVITERSIDEIDFNVEAPKEIHEEKNDSIIYDNSKVEVSPEFPCGNSKMLLFINKNYKIPDEQKKEANNTKVVVNFVVQKDGSLTDVKVLRDVGLETSKEAIRVIKKMPNWNPAMLNGKKVKCSYTIIF